MRTIIAVLVLSICAQSAVAKGPDCRAIESTTARLACYDAVYPLKLEKPAIVENDAGRPAMAVQALQKRQRQHRTVSTGLVGTHRSTSGWFSSRSQSRQHEPRRAYPRASAV
jgi:hypothetical protein